MTASKRTTTMPYETVCWTPAAAIAVSAYTGKPNAMSDPAPHRSRHHLKRQAITACKQSCRALGLGARGEVYTRNEAGQRCTEFSCIIVNGNTGKPTLQTEDIT